MTGDETPRGPGTTVGPYRLVEPIGRGGMGDVWRAADVRPGADRLDVAVKFIAVERLGDPEARARFVREIAAARRVEAVEVAAVVDADPTDDTPWLASVFVPGPTVADHVRADGPLAEPALRSLGLGLARGLDAIHRAGVVHRDLTPGNVVLGPDGPVIVDFGVSRIDDETTITRSGSLVGTPAWMAPEQLRDDEVSDASDVWAWGAVMVYASTGHPPVSGERTETVIARVLEGALDLGGVPDWLDPSVRWALDPTPARRPTAYELTARLDRSGRGTAAAAVTQAEPVTRIAPEPTQPTVVDGGAGVPPRDQVADRRRGWRRPAIRAGVLFAGMAVGLLVPILLAVVGFTVAVLAAIGLRIWTEERGDGATPTIGAATVLVASVLMLVTALSSVIGFSLAVAAVVALFAVFVAIGGDIG